MTSIQRVIKYCAIAFAVLLAIGIISGIVTFAVNFVSIFSGHTFSNSNKEYINYSETFKDIDKLDIHTSIGRLEIKEGSQILVEAEDVIDGFKVKKSFRGTLIIENEESWFNNIFNWFGTERTRKPRITLYLPKDFVAKETKIDTGTGNVEIEVLKTEKLMIDAGTGDIKGNSISAEEVLIDGGVGNIILKNIVFTDANINCGVGNVTIEGSLFGKNEIDCGVGDVTLDIVGALDDYNIDIDSGVGTVRLNGDKVSDVNRKSESAKHSLEVDGGVGNVRINIEE